MSKISESVKEEYDQSVSQEELGQLVFQRRVGSRSHSEQGWVSQSVKEELVSQR